LCHIFSKIELEMKTLTIREAREGLSHPEQMFADSEEVLVVRHGEPVARILPVEPKRRGRPLRAFLEAQPMQSVTSETLLAEEREDRV
jgi:antitoxin (DNA-binding transcriptional repressor) of toxin-antitoxin stability system